MATTHPSVPEDGPLFELDDVPPDDQEVVAAEIRALMGRRKISQSRLAGALGMSTASLSERLNGKSNFTVRELYRIARLFRVSIRDLFPPLIAAVAASLYVTRNEHPPNIQGGATATTYLQQSLFIDVELPKSVGPGVAAEQTAGDLQIGGSVTQKEAA